MPIDVVLEALRAWVRDALDARDPDLAVARRAVLQDLIDRLYGTHKVR